MATAMQTGLTRRTFFQVSASAIGGLMVSLYLDLPLLAQDQKVKSPPDAFIAIHPDGNIIIQVNRLEFGQGVSTALPLVLADELDADWSQVVPELAPAADVYKDPIRGMQMVGGSGSISTSFMQYRELGARTRAMLIAAAAKRWGVSPDACSAEAGVVHGPGGKSAKYGELASDAAQQPVPATVTLKEPAQFRLIGKTTKRLDSRAKCDGSQKFGLDVDLPGMLVALVAHPPVFGAKVKSVDDAATRKLTGVKDVFEVPVAPGGSGVAVVADKFWTTKQARDRLKIDWELAGLQLADSDELWSRFRELGRTKGMVAIARGDETAIDHIPESDRIIAQFEFPYLAHCPMEPLNTTVRFDGDKAEVWAGSQLQGVDQMAIAQTLGLKPAQVTFHTEMAGGGFGRRAVIDSHVQREAAAIAQHLKGTPVQLIWTREDDVQGGYYRPMHLHRVEIGIGSNGMPVAWRHVIVGQSLLAGTPFAPKGGGVDPAVVEGVADTPYSVANFHVSAHQPTINVPVLWWRSVGNTHTAFVMETLIDELATRAKMDEIEYRRRLLDPKASKLRAAVDLLAEKAVWRNGLPQGHAVGIACHYSFETGVACAADVSLDHSRPRVHRVTVAVDLGLAVNPLTIESQVQGGLTFGLSQLVPKGAITLKDGRVEQRNFDTYAPPYISQAPLAVDVHIVPSTQAPSGIGEPPVPVIAPAVVNALAKLTGKRYRTLPLASL
ncbi:MAG TPA: xanthine dehydrogenase family protein molybdopterin-binding subunit [Terriglobales bacterium]|nr:xanthine dehydrogenase family protein molybdopterin-binding subunit [Terriglobales bacterium]